MAKPHRHATCMCGAVATHQGTSPSGRVYFLCGKHKGSGNLTRRGRLHFPLKRPTKVRKNKKARRDPKAAGWGGRVRKSTKAQRLLRAAKKAGQRWYHDGKKWVQLVVAPPKSKKRRRTAKQKAAAKRQGRRMRAAAKKHRKKARRTKKQKAASLRNIKKAHRKNRKGKRRGKKKSKR